jgi:polysaccharide biosynthesis transport protein
MSLTMRGRSERSDDESVFDDATDATANVPAVPQGSSLELASPMPRYDDLPWEITESLRTIVNRYELRTADSLPTSIAVTSALAGEGVTTMSQALATLIAQEMGRFVCWVDCGWLTGRTGASVAGQPDLLDLLDDLAQIHSAFQTAPDLPGLISLAPGPVPESKRNLIVRSPAFERLLRVLTQEFDHVVFDLPPVLSSANSLAMLRQADASLFVVRHRSTTVAQLRRAIDSTQPTPNLGIVINRYRTSIPARVRRLLDA